MCAWLLDMQPFFWIAATPGRNISYHLVLHNTPRGVHFFSADGTNWHLQQTLDSKGDPQAPYFFNEVVHYTDGTNVTVDRRERPWMMFNEDGAPKLLVTSMSGGNSEGDASVWTMVQGVRQLV